MNTVLMSLTSRSVYHSVMAWLESIRINAKRDVSWSLSKLSIRLIQYNNIIYKSLGRCTLTDRSLDAQKLYRNLPAEQSNSESYFNNAILLLVYFSWDADSTSSINYTWGTRAADGRLRRSPEGLWRDLRLSRESILAQTPRRLPKRRFYSSQIDNIFRTSHFWTTGTNRRYFLYCYCWLFLF